MTVYSIFVDLLRLVGKSASDEKIFMYAIDKWKCCCRCEIIIGLVFVRTRYLMSNCSACLIEFHRRAVIFHAKVIYTRARERERQEIGRRREQWWEDCGMMLHHQSAGKHQLNTLALCILDWRIDNIVTPIIHVRLQLIAILFDIRNNYQFGFCIILFFPYR